MRSFCVEGTLISVDQYRLVLKVRAADVERIGAIKLLHKKENPSGDFITINAKSARYFISNLDWANVSDLIGVNLHVECTVRTYTAHRPLPKPYAKKSQTPSSVYMHLVSFVGQTIRNVV